MDIINKFIDTEIEPDLVAENVEVLYSDSARLQMRMVTPLTKHFTSATEQREEYPEGLQVWFYEKTGELKGHISANWAKRDIVNDLWEARGNVVAIDDEGKKLETEQLFWDPQKRFAYSVIYTKITSETGIEAAGDNGFNAKQRDSEWEWQLLRGTKGSIIIPMTDEEPNEE